MVKYKIFVKLNLKDFTLLYPGRVIMQTRGQVF